MKECNQSALSHYIHLKAIGNIEQTS
jgi:hypothetical protein